MTVDPLTQFLAAMSGMTLRGARIDMSAEDIADAIWLAPHLIAPEVGPEASGDVGPAAPAAANVPEAPTPDYGESPDTAPSPKSRAEGHRRLAGRRGELHLPAASGPGRGGRTLRAPTGAALPGSLALARALRPLRRRVPSRTRHVLDMAETVRRVAEEGVWLPALRPARDRWLDLALVVDAGASMGPWRSTATELLKLLSCIGAFRTVRIWNLDTDVSPPRLRAGLVRRSAAPERDPRELVDPAGRSLVLVVTDCVSGAWYDGEAAKLLETWRGADQSACSWFCPNTFGHGHARDRCGDAPQVPLCRSVECTAGSPADRCVDVCSDEVGAPLPVASLVPEALSAWARLVAGAGGAESTGFVLRTRATTSVSATGPDGNVPRGPVVAILACSIADGSPPRRTARRVTCDQPACHPPRPSSAAAGGPASP